MALTSFSKKYFTSFLNINGYDVPCPRAGFSYELITTVNSGRNVNNAFNGQKIGRQIFKFNGLQWVGLKPEERMAILNAIEPFTVPVTFEDCRTGKPITIMMYTGNITVKPLFVDKETHQVTQDEILAFNLIDCGLE